MTRIFPSLLFSVIGAMAAQPELRTAMEVMNQVRAESWPQLRGAQITVEPLRSDSVFFETRFTFPSYFFRGSLQYMIFFNEQAIKRGVPPDGFRAILAHELAHVDYYQSQSRMGLAGLVRLLSPSFNATFERIADLKAISLGYGPGLAHYREWLYRNIPASAMPGKKRDYFSPQEIYAILLAESRRPGTIMALSRCVPRNLKEIESRERNPAARCPN